MLSYFLPAGGEAEWICGCETVGGGVVSARCEWPNKLLWFRANRLEKHRFKAQPFALRQRRPESETPFGVRRSFSAFFAYGFAGRLFFFIFFYSFIPYTTPPTANVAA